MHFRSTIGLLALVAASSANLAGAAQALIHIEVNDIDTFDYYQRDSAPAGMSKQDADTVCAKDPAYGPNYEACMGGPNGSPSGCVCKASACLQPCFGNMYSSPKDGSRGCCALGQTFSYDEKSLEGSCCSNGTAYSWDPNTKSGACCAGAPEAKFTGGVGYCSIDQPCSRPYPPSVKVGGKSFLKFSNRGTWGTNIFGGENAKTFDDCLAVCAANPKCVAIDFQRTAKTCWPKSDSNVKVPPVQNGEVDSAISPPCLKKDDSCPEIDGTIRVYGGVGYTMNCKKIVGIGNVVPTYTTDSMLGCISDCSMNPKCQGINYPIGGGKGDCNLKSNYEESPTANDNYVAAIPLVKRG